MHRPVVSFLGDNTPSTTSPPTPLSAAQPPCTQELGLAGEMGSGYPGDATTVAWLKANLHPVLGLPRIARFSWETCAR